MNSTTPIAQRDPAAGARANYDYGNDRINQPELVAALEAAVEGDVRFDEYSRMLYATDASAYEVVPVGVVYPVSTADVAAVMRLCAREQIPVLPRGGGTSLAGQSTNEAVVLDFTRYMGAILDVDPDGATARAEVGCTLGELNRRLAPHGLKFAPDPSTGDQSALGGAIGNNTTGAHSLIYGKTDAYVEEVTAVLADGSIVEFGEVSLDTLRAEADADAAAPLPRIYGEVLRIIDEEAEEIRAQYPTLKRNVSGYALDVLLQEAEATGRVNLARLLVGSEGTLAIVTEATVSLEPVPETKALGLLTYHSLLDAMEDVGDILEHEPAAVEVLDGVLVELARGLTEFKDVIGILPDETDTFLLVEFYADDDAERRAKVEALLEDRVGQVAFDGLSAYDAQEQKDFWKMRKASTPILLSRTGDEKHIAFIEDIAIPPEHLVEYTADFKQVFEDHGTFGSFYAHAGPGCMHVRPLINVKTDAGVESMVSISDAATDLAVKYGGAVSGEHGDGRARTQWNRKLYGEQLWAVFRRLKSAYDPDWLLNPGSVCGDHDMSEHLRFGPEYEFEAGFEPTLNWDNENGFQGMVELCHGCGGCRSSQEGTGGVMCPTYRASQEEMTTTRGRANMLRQAMSGTLDRDEMTSDEFVHEVLDLCIGCKGCSKDCPSEVDMAKLKVEVEHQYLKEHGPSVRDRIFANIELLSKLGSATAPVSNLFPQLPGARLLMEKTIGIARERSLPAFHRRTLVDWFDRRGGAQVPLESATRRALLFPDTYTNHSNPKAGRAAVRVLEAAGVHVAIPEGVTGSGRPPHSKGFLEKARAHAAQNTDALAPAVEEGWDVVVVEPSDAVMFQSDYLDLLRGPAVEAVAANTYGIMEYLDCFQLDAELAVAPTGAQLTYHGHCHQKSTKKDHHAVGVLRRVGYGVDPLDSTCCGMAGSFGYEAEHYSMSQAVGRLLFAQIDRSDGESVVAPGNSCRSQIGDEYGEKPPHPIERVAEILQPAA